MFFAVKKIKKIKIKKCFADELLYIYIYIYIL
jgi:hypothetical protein